MFGYNKGDSYEELVLEICRKKGIVPHSFQRAGAGGGADICFVHKGIPRNLEVKLDLSADYGQKMLKWNNTDSWQFCVDDKVTQLYKEIGVLARIDTEFTPRRFVTERECIDLADKRYDQKCFEQSCGIGINQLFDFYALKNTFYMQVGGFGFYHLFQDILNLGTPQFDAKIWLRLRAKTIHSKPTWKYGFYAVLKVKGKPTPSHFDLEEKEGRLFPPIRR